MFKKFLVTFGLTILVGVFLILIFSSTLFKSSGFAFFAVVILAISYGFFNAIFVTLISYSKIGFAFITKLKYLLVEIVLLYLIYFGIVMFVKIIPSQYKFYNTPQESGERIFFSFQFELLYTFIILFVALQLIKKISKINTTQDGGNEQNK